MKQHLHGILRKCALSLIALACAQSSFSQVGIFNEMEAGVTFGPANFLGDLGGTKGRGMGFLKDNNISKTKFFVGAHLTGYVNAFFAMRLAVNYGTITGADEIIKGQGGLEESRKFRNSDFRSKIYEGFIAAELYPSVFFEYDFEELYHKFRPYGLLGVGVFNFNPQGTDPLTGQYVSLKELSTEGQGFAEYPDRKVYKTTQLNIPMGIGLKYFVNENTSVSFEVVHRKTFTDYIDDVSTTYIDPNLYDKYFGIGSQKAQLARRMANKTDQGSTTSAGYAPGDKRGTATNKDGYYTFGFKVSFRIPRNEDKDNYKPLKCPTLRF